MQFETPPCKFSFILLPQRSCAFQEDWRLAWDTDGRVGEGSAIPAYFDLLYLFVFNIKRLNPKNECIGCLELSGWQALCATACSMLLVNFLLMPIGPLFCIVRSSAVPWVGVPGLGLCPLCSIRAWQNNGEKCERVLTQAHVWMADWSHLAGQLGLGLLLWGWNVNISSQLLLCQFETGRAFLSKFPHFYSLQRGQEFFSSVRQ